MDEQNPNIKAAYPAPLSVMLGAEQQSLNTLMGGLSSVISNHKFEAQGAGIFHVVDMNLRDGMFASGLVDGYRNLGAGEDRPIIVSGTHSDETQVETVRAALLGKNALGQVHALDATTTVAKILRNKLECVGGGDLVMYAHAAYPGQLPGFKLPRMVDRLADMVSPHGAVVTLHNSGPSDVEDIRRKVLHLPNFASPGLTCDTHGRLEQAFSGTKMYSFSITVPNLVKLPANEKAIQALFNGEEAALEGQDATDAAKIRNVLEVIAGGKQTLDEAIAEMGDASREQAQRYFAERAMNAGDSTFSLSVGGGQMIMAFRSLDVARGAFDAISQKAAQMNPPALTLPITRDVAPTLDKTGAYAEWKETLAEKHGITNPPAVGQAAIKSSLLR